MNHEPMTFLGHPRRSVSLVFVHESESSFILHDLEALSKLFHVTQVRWRGPAMIPGLIIAILRADLVLTWFAAGQAATSAFFISKALGKKVVHIAAGSEVSIDPLVNGADLRSRIRFFFTRIMLSNADMIIAVSHFTSRELCSHSTPKNLTVIEHGIDTKMFNCTTRKIGTVLTVASGKPEQTVLRKGLDRFAELARVLPHLQFVMIGEEEEDSEEEEEEDSRVKSPICHSFSFLQE